MLIRSQDRMTLIDANNIAAMEIGETYKGADTDYAISIEAMNYSNTIGVYSSKEKALRVLENLEEAIIWSIDEETPSTFYMPEDWSEKKSQAETKPQGETKPKTETKLHGNTKLRKTSHIRELLDAVLAKCREAERYKRYVTMDVVIGTLEDLDEALEQDEEQEEK